MHMVAMRGKFPDAYFKAKTEILIILINDGEMMKFDNFADSWRWTIMYWDNWNWLNL